ncbi:hypothetical protein SAMN05443144_10652 [Fodinibius roseus]|uniref:Uncharacterized protein n=1 Tax=Fodinibius roseus TaxID=1194090 RepID=A0A1M4ZJU2_9BACT|nr:hypothetical protein [Fodinibius roseus]SHF18248.1 hypothetical protein SAMN05443144_10652 [Fodinibius roseus]
MIMKCAASIVLKSAMLICLLSISLTTPAQVPDSSADSTTQQQDKTVEQILREMEQERQAAPGPSFPDSIISPPTPAQQKLFDDSTMAVYQDAMYAYYEYRVSGFEHRKEVFAWQLFSSKLIFWSVLLLVLSGISFSGIQFYKSIRNQQADGETATEDSVTEFEASARGIKVTSPVLGVIILVISLAFFYLYLVYVHPIREIF